MFRAIALTLVTASCLPLAALAEPASATQQLGQCLADNTSGKDRKDLARWIFFAMAAHPEIKQFAVADLPKHGDDVHRATAATFMRLLTADCAAQTRAAASAGGTVAIQQAFQTLGQLAMQELMSEPAVAAGMGQFERYLDQAKLSEALRPR